MTSTLVAPAYTAVDKVPLGRRIEEIKKEKGGYYSNVAMAARLGIHHETLRLMLKGKREIYTFELDKIAKDLKVPVERILQEDIEQEVEHLARQLQDKNQSTETIDTATRLSQQSLGLTERHHAFMRLGLAYRNAFRFSDSNKALQESYNAALLIKESYNEIDAVVGVVYHLAASFTDIQDYTSAAKLLKEVEHFFVSEPRILSSIAYQKAKIEEARGNVHRALQYSSDSLQHAIITENHVLIASTRLNLSHYKYLSFDYQASRELLELAILDLQEEIRIQLIARKELVKVLLKLGLKAQAMRQIEIAHNDAKKMSWQDMCGKLTILLTLASDDPSHAQYILDETSNSLKIRYLACKCLREYYKTLNDSSQFLHYSKIAEEFCIDFADFLDEGEL